MALDPNDVAGVCDYMNDPSMADHMRFIAERLAGAELESDVRLVDITEAHGLFAITKNGETREAPIPWPYPVTNRAEMKTALFALMDKAMLG